MNRFGKFLAILSVGAMTAVAPLSSANAQGDFATSNGWAPQDSIMAGDPSQRADRRYYGNGIQFRNNGRNYNHGRHYNRAARHYNRGGNNNGLAIGLGIAAGALALGVIANSQRPHAIYPSAGRASGMAPWSTSWYRYCDRKYRSFNTSTGTYRGYDGRDHFCVAN